MPAVTDSYFSSTEDADAVLAKRLGNTAWASATSATKTAALQQATSTIDALDYTGFTQSSDQPRQFPRKYLIDPYEYSPWSNILVIDMYGYYSESANVPNKIMLACALEASALVEYYSASSGSGVINEQELVSKGVKSFSLGKLSMSFGRSESASVGFKSNDSYNLLEEYIQNSYLIQ